MKRNYLVMGMVTVAIGLWTGCAQTNVIDSAMETKGEVIGFSTYANKTRGVPIADNFGFAIKDSTFGVTAFINTDGNNAAYMGTTTVGAQIKYATAWDYVSPADTRYWPTGSETLDFYAYAPFTNNERKATPAMSKADGMKFENYTVPAYANQNDFMYASALAVTKSTNGATSDTLKLTFKHALTQILFKAKTSQSNLYVDIQKDGIELHNINNKGTFTVKKNATTPTTIDPIWTVSTVPTDLKTTYIAPTKQVIAENATTVELINTAPTSADALMLMPQTLTAWNITTNKTITAADAAHQSYLKIMCKIFYSTGKSTTPGTYENQVYLHGAATGTDNGYVPLYVPFSSAATQGSTSKTAWEMGNKVTYTLIFGGGYNDKGEPILTPITFETAVDPWTDATSNIDIKP